MDSDDEVSPTSETALSDNMAITVYRVEYSERTVTETIHFTKKTVKSASMFSGESKVTQKGADGSKTVTYRDKIVDGKVASSDAISKLFSKRQRRKLQRWAPNSASPLQS